MTEYKEIQEQTYLNLGTVPCQVDTLNNKN